MRMMVHQQGQQQLRAWQHALQSAQTAQQATMAQPLGGAAGTHLHATCSHRRKLTQKRGYATSPAGDRRA
jgi:hypothetical protein